MEEQDLESAQNRAYPVLYTKRSLGSLREVVEFYDAGGVPNDLLDTLIALLRLDEQQKRDLIVFLESLTGSNVNILVADAFSAPIGDIKKCDPNWVYGTADEVR